MQSNRWVMGGALGSALLASLCCIGPLVLAGLGFSGAVFFQRFAAWRPWLLGVTALALGLGFYLAYRKPAACGPDEACTPNPRLIRTGRISLWTVTALTVALGAFPYYGGRWLARSGTTAPAPAAPALRPVHLRVEGMTCAGCETHVNAALEDLAGVRVVEVSYERSSAIVQAPPAVTDAALVAAVEATGYAAAVRPDASSTP